jgi:hypothetical protein
VEVSHADTIYSRVLHVKQKIARRLIFTGLDVKSLIKPVGLTRTINLTACYL